MQIYVHYLSHQEDYKGTGSDKAEERSNRLGAWSKAEGVQTRENYKDTYI